MCEGMSHVLNNSYFCDFAIPRNLAQISILSLETHIRNKIVKMLFWGDFIGKTNFAVLIYANKRAHFQFITKRCGIKSEAITKIFIFKVLCVPEK